MNAITALDVEDSLAKKKLLGIAVKSLKICD